MTSDLAWWFQGRCCKRYVLKLVGESDVEVRNQELRQGETYAEIHTWEVACSCEGGTEPFWNSGCIKFEAGRSRWKLEQGISHRSCSWMCALTCKWCGTIEAFPLLTEVIRRDCGWNCFIGLWGGHLWSRDTIKYIHIYMLLNKYMPFYTIYHVLYIYILCTYIYLYTYI